MSVAAHALPVPLTVLPRGARALVHCVLDDTPVIDDALHSTVGQRLIELGFVHGVEVEVIETIVQRSLLDRLAMSLSGLCALHCVVTALFLGALLGDLVDGVCVAHDAGAGVVPEDAGEALVGGLAAVADDDDA